MFGSINAIPGEWAEFWKLSGQGFLLMNKTAEAEKALVRALGRASRPDPELRYYLGLVRLRQGESDDAFYEAEQVLRIKPRFAPARRLLSDAALVQLEYMLAGP